MSTPYVSYYPSAGHGPDFLNAYDETLSGGKICVNLRDAADDMIPTWYPKSGLPAALP
jgi:hypothetical protein